MQGRGLQSCHLVACFSAPRIFSLFHSAIYIKPLEIKSLVIVPGSFSLYRVNFSANEVFKLNRHSTAGTVPVQQYPTAAV